ncbi:MAG: type I-MYXAN CRISPR-associated protein Cas6/Cmx6 [Gallionellaceae bacterium]|jgi:CRISPR-associated protein Cas6
MANESVVNALNIETQEMVDVVFDLNGSTVPASYPFILWSELLRCLPWLGETGNIGVHPLRGSASGDNILLSRRTKLILRLPAERAAEAYSLSGQQLNIDGNVLIVGQARDRPLQAATTLHSYIVESKLGEVEFLADMKQKLQAMNIPCNLICDKYRKINDGNNSLSGFGLVLHDLKPAASLHIQRAGLGGSRYLGCGIFVPFKSISGLD